MTPGGAVVVGMMLLTGSEWGLPGGGESLSVQFIDGRVPGGSGCNRFGGCYSQDGATVRISQLISTHMACADDGMRKERDGLAMLAAVRPVDARHAVLVLNDAAGTILVTLACCDWDERINEKQRAEKLLLRPPAVVH